jgi:hypothetical protein
MYGSIPLTHGRNFFGFTFMDFSGEWLIDFGEKKKKELSDGKVVCFSVLQQNWWQCSHYFPFILFLHASSQMYVCSGFYCVLQVCSKVTIS